MSEIEWRGITPEEMIRDIESSVKQYRENKYVFQVGLKDLDFDINQELLEAQWIKSPIYNHPKRRKSVNRKSDCAPKAD